MTVSGNPYANAPGNEEAPAQIVDVHLPEPDGDSREGDDRWADEARSVAPKTAERAGS